MFVGVGIGPTPSHLILLFSKSLFIISYIFRTRSSFLLLENVSILLSNGLFFYKNIDIFSHLAYLYNLLLEKDKAHSHHILCIQNNFPLDYLFFLIDTCCKNLLYQLFSLCPHQNKTLLSLVYIHFFLMAYLLYSICCSSNIYANLA